MRAEIISIGTELLVGSITNTNARFLSHELAQRAVDVYRQTTVGDNADRIVAALKAAASRSDILVTSGGLGPTEDDITSKAAARFLGRPLVFHKPTYRHILRRLQKRKLRMTPLIATQCRVPEGSHVFENAMGTAPGTLSSFEWGGEKKWLLVLPGPPRELEPLFFKAWPWLSRMAKIKKEYFEVRAVRLAGLLESQVAEKVTDLLKLKPPVTVGIYAKPQEVELKIMAKSAARNAAVRSAGVIEKKIRKRFGKHVFGTNEDTLASVTGALLLKKKRTLSAAESCTGGLFSNLITDSPGSSRYFAGGTIVYSNKLKTSLLGIDKSLIKKYGAVSRPVAEAMAKNVKKRLGTDYGVGITGIAGPDGGSSQKPVGLVYIALAGPKRVLAVKKLFLGNRLTVKRSSALTALDLLRSELLKG